MPRPGRPRSSRPAKPERNEDWHDAAFAARSLRRRELARIACADLLGLVDTAALGRALTELTAATVDAALRTAQRVVAAEHPDAAPVRLALVGMGRTGGHEQGYGSDADVLIVYEPVDGPDSPEVTATAAAVARELRRLLAMPGPDPGVELDVRLRPEGRSGPLVRSLDSYRQYYARWSAGWEGQALLRAGLFAGDHELSVRFLTTIDPLRYPEGGISDATRSEIRRLKARMEAERLPRGIDPASHLKLGPGGLSDVEWSVQLLQLRHGYAVAGLRTTSTVEALSAAADDRLLSPVDAQVLTAAWRMASALRNAIVLSQGRPSDVLPRDPRALATVARAMGYPAGHTGQLIEQWSRLARRARAVHERLFAP